MRAVDAWDQLYHIVGKARVGSMDLDGSVVGVLAVGAVEMH